MDDKVLLDVEINAKDALESYSKIKIRIDELRDSQKKLKQSGLENSQVYLETDQKIKALSSRAQEYQKTIQQQVKADHELQGSLQQLKAELSLYTQAYNKLSEYERNDREGLMFQARIVETTKKLNEAEQSLLNYHRQVGNYGMVAKDLAAEMKSLKDQLVGMADAGLKGTKEFEEMRKRVDEINKALNPFSDELKGAQQQLKLLQDKMIEMKLAGKEDSDEFRNMADEAAKLKDAIADVQQNISNLANDSGKLQAVAQSLSFAANAMAILEKTTEEYGVGIPWLQDTLKSLAAATSALTLVIQLQQAAQKQTLVYRAAEAIVNKSHIKDLASMRIAQLAETKAKSSSIIVTKAATIATAAWNAVLAANPVMLIVAALALLGAALVAGINMFGKSARAQKDAEKASKEYAKQEAETAKVLDGIEADRSKQINDISNSMRQEIVEMKKRGASEEEIAKYKLQREQEIRDVELDSCKQRQAANELLIKAKQNQVAAETKLLSTMKEGSKKYEEQKKKVDELNASLRSLQKTQADEVQKANDILIQNIEAEQQAAEERRKRAQKNASDQLDLQRMTEEEKLKAQKRSDELSLDASEATQEERFANQQKWEKLMFDANQAFEKRKLAQQRRNGQITQAEYNNQLKRLETAQQAFMASQADAAKKEVLRQYQDVLSSVGKQTQLVLEDIDKGVASNLKTVASQLGIDDAFKTEYERLVELKAMYDEQDKLASTRHDWRQNASGATREEDMKRLAEMEQSMFEYYRIEYELKRRAEEQKTAIELAEVDKRLGLVFQAIEDSDALALLDFTKTEEEKNNIAIAQSQKRIDALKKELEAEQDPKVRLELQKRIAEEEDAIHETQLQNIQNNLDKELLDTTLSAKKKYDIKQEYLAKELEAVKGNADAEDEINRQMADARREYLNSVADSLSEWGGQALSVMNSISDAMSAVSDRQLAEFEESQEREKEALKERLDSGLVSQKEYDASVAQMDAELEEKKKEADIKAAKRQKAISIMEAAINTAAAIMKIWAEVPKFDFGASTIALTAATAAIGAAQIASIAAQPLPKASRGMLLRGPSHAQGGIPIEAEGGEAIINKKATKRYLPLLSAINESTGGVPLYANGGMVRQASRQSSVVIDYKMIAEAMSHVQINSQVAVTDINRGQRNMSQVEQLRTY